MISYKREWKVEEGDQAVYITLSKGALENEPTISLSRTDKVSPQLARNLIEGLNDALDSIEQGG